ncbi:hypothetical protein DN402_06215 [Streptomyces sp. SW4]|nr:hypothetical protein DN402_06215 [Streptomyces sp. SW4]
MGAGRAGPPVPPVPPVPPGATVRHRRPGGAGRCARARPVPGPDGGAAAAIRAAVAEVLGVADAGALDPDADLFDLGRPRSA